MRVAYPAALVLCTVLTIAPAAAQSVPPRASEVAGASLLRAAADNPVNRTRGLGDIRGAADGVRPDQLVQIARWQGVAQCVVDRNGDASLAYATAPRGSTLATTAARELKPVFATCLAGSRVNDAGSVVLRRAALADVLGVTPAR